MRAEVRHRPCLALEPPAPARDHEQVEVRSGAGFLDRREDDNDRRRTIISLPERIRAPLEQVANAKLTALRRTLEHLEPPAREHFLEGLRLLAGEAAVDASG
jgi:DNA-binding MarR family transcriptional regulator